MSISADDFQAVQKFLLENSGISLAAGKEYLVEGRLQSLVHSEEFDDLHALIVKLRGGREGDLSRKVMEALTTNETSFFRDKHPFETLRTAIIPDLFNKPELGKQITIWSAASSSGQEPYSLAMLLADSFAWATDWQIKIVASDISEEMLPNAVPDCTPSSKFHGGFRRITFPGFFRGPGPNGKPNLKSGSALIFATSTFARTGGLPRMDIIFMRNVLIYFEADTKKTILEKVLKVLKPGGYLFLGSGEAPVGLEDRFQPTDFSISACFKLAPT